MKLNLIRVLGAALALTCGRAVAAEGDVWEILPCTELGATLPTPVSSVLNPLTGGDVVYFKVNLISRDGTNEKRWYLQSLLPGSSVLNEPQLGIYVSGKLTYADYHAIIDGEDGISQVIFKYVVKPGDFALPIRLATASGPADETYHEDFAYYFNPTRTQYWSFRDADGNTCNWWFFQGDPTSRGKGEWAETQDYSLKDAGFYAKTIDFDDNWEEEPEYDYDHNLIAGIWRSVHEGGTATVGPTPALASLAGPEEKTTYYVWSTNEAVVKVVSTKQVRMRTGGTEGAPISNLYYVAEVTFERGQLTSEFEIEGIKCTNTTDLVLSAYDHFSYNSASGDRNIDYITVPVQCTGVLPPSITITPGKKTVEATSDYLTYVTELSVKFSVAYTNDVTFTITPRFESDEAREAGADWKDYIRVSDAKELSSISTATNFTFTIPKGEKVPMENGSERKIYLYALRSDKWTINAAHIQFVANTDDPAAQQDIKNFGQTQGDINITAQDPEIVLPVEGDDSMTAVVGRDRTLRIQVDDTYADKYSDDGTALGYEVWINLNSDQGGTFERVGGTEARYYVGQGGYLYLTNTTDVLPTVKYTEQGENKSIIYVKSPISGNQSAERNFTVTVAAPASFEVSTVDGNYDFNEGDEVNIQVVIDRQNTTGKALYAFLVPVTSRDREAADCEFFAESNGVSSLVIEQLGTTASGTFTMIDGCTSAALSQFNYKIELRTARVYEEGEVVDTFICKNTLSLKSRNVIPYVKYVQMNGSRSQRVSESGGTMKMKLPAGETIQTFTVGVEEPGTADKTSTNSPFQVRWTFEDENGNAYDPPIGCGEDGIIYGNPDYTVCSNKFIAYGIYKITVDLKDKDMSDFGNGTLDQVFEFYVEVLDNPSITITPNYTQAYDRFYETEAGEASISIDLGLNNCLKPITARLTVQPPAADNPGAFVLQPRAYTAGLGGIVDLGGGVYEVTFPPKKTSVMATVIALDGTAASARKSDGFVLSTEMITDDYIVPQSGNKTPKEYYLGVDCQILVQNVEPQIDYISPIPSTNRINAAIGTVSEAIVFSFDDVTNDFTKGISIEFKGGGGFKTNFTDRTEANKWSSEIGFKPTFTSDGEQIVQLILKDVDNGVATYYGADIIWYYTIAVSKKMTMVPTGPTGGRGSALSKKYFGAGNIGEGRVWAQGDSGVSEWTHTVNCQLASGWTVYGYGYKVGDVEGALSQYPARDYKVDSSGNGDTLNPGYVYQGEYDSFLYAWLYSVVGSDDSESSSYSRLDDTICPEYPEVKDVGSRVTLPTEAKETTGTAKTYDDTFVEAIFSKELYPADNCGDINGDRIPDVYIVKYGVGFGILDADGKVTGNDLTKITAFNLDGETEDSQGEGDFLPGALDSANTALTGEASDLKAFTAVFEIRGFGEGLNDAPSQTGIKGVEPGRNYNNPTNDSASTLSELEYVAWCKYADDNGLNKDSSDDWKKWSPERPTDPTLVDTDFDGYDDGFEYFFWYRAHVGYLDDKGKHHFLTGRKFDAANPLEYTVLSSEDIANLSDPLVAAGVDADERDSDNDALTDRLEYYLGTNPFDCDTDGDGLIDGWEVIRGLNPLAKTEIQDGKSNPDGDFMADAELDPLIFVEFDKTDGEKTIHYVYISSDEDFYKAIDGKIESTTNFYGVCIYSGEKDEAITNYVEDTTKVFFKFNGMPNGHALTGALIPRTRKLVRRQVRINPDEVDEGSLVLTFVENGKYHLLHDQVFAYFGFDPRTAWNITSTGFVSDRWNPGYNSAVKKLSDVGDPVNTRKYTTLDEFLLYQYRSATDIKLSGDKLLDKLEKGTTNPSLPFGVKSYVDNDVESKESESDNYGADTDADGVPDGWELYVGASHELEWNADKNQFVENDTIFYSPNNEKDAVSTSDGDKLSLVTEFAGTDSSIAYYDCPSVITNAGKVWANKFFPSNPWDKDTDGDTIEDDEEGSQWKATFPSGKATATQCYFSFNYSDWNLGTNPSEYDFKTICFRGGGSNPCSVDTDLDGLPDPWERQFAGLAVEADGTVMFGNNDAFYTRELKLADGLLTSDNSESGMNTNDMTVVAKGAYIFGGMDATYSGDTWTKTKVDSRTGTRRDMDFDGDGLQNYQEYLVQAVRSFRYDDGETPLNGRVVQWQGDESADSDYVPANITITDAVEDYSYPAFDYLHAGKCFEAVVEEKEVEDSDHKMLETYLNENNLYPNGVISESGEVVVEPQKWDFARMGYFAKCPHDWDPWNLHENGQKCCWGKENGYKLMLPPSSLRYFSIGTKPFGKKMGESMGFDGQYRVSASGYVSTDPRMKDTDSDGMDDFYELYHGMNPIYGASLDGSSSVDIIAEMYGNTIGAFANAWNYYDRYQMFGEGIRYNFVKYPWTAGAPDADPDGDELRNADEMIAGNLTSPTTKHTDPTPLWMTEPTAKLSVTRQSYVLPSMSGTKDWSRYPWQFGSEDGLIVTLTESGGALDGNYAEVYSFAFERNEGYDTDGDWSSDSREATASVIPVSDPLYFGDPVRRAALYLDGEGAAYQIELGGGIVQQDAYDMFRQFTVECWIKPEDCLGEQVIVERGSMYQPATSGEIQGSSHFRANFRLYLENGFVKGMFDSSAAVESGTDDQISSCRVVGSQLATNTWTHVALTYDGAALRLYINGGEPFKADAALIPANGIVAILQNPEAVNYPNASYVAHDSAIVIGARHQDASDPTKCKENPFADFFKGAYRGNIAEVRIWDGARSAVDIRNDKDKAYTLADVAANRDAVYSAWLVGRTRNDAEMAAKNLTVLPPQLMMHYNFNSLPGGTEPGEVIQAPVKFGVDPEVDADLRMPSWWNDTASHSSVYTNYCVIPWIQNSVLHLPQYDGGFLDSIYWNDNHAGYLASKNAGVGVDSFAIPDSANPYGVTTFGYERYNREFQLSRLKEYDSEFTDIYKRYVFGVRSSWIGSSDLVPLGSAWAKRATDYWDGNGAVAAWTDTCTDSNYDGLPDWWTKLYQDYAEGQGITNIWPNTADPKTGFTFGQLYARDLAQGMTPSAKSRSDFDSKLENTADVDKDGMYDWWEDLYGIQGNDSSDRDLDPDNDGLTNYQEFRYSREYSDIQLNPVSSISLDRNIQAVSDYYLPYGGFANSLRSLLATNLKSRRGYLGFFASDHDFMEDWWEAQYDKGYSDPNVYDPWDDADGDGWSNYAECRAALWGGNFTANKIDQFTDSDEENHLQCHPQPGIGVRLVYNGTMFTAGRTIVIRTISGQSPRVDATYLIEGSQNGVQSDTHVLGGWLAGAVFRGFLNPGSIQEGTAKLEAATLSSDQVYSWLVTSKGESYTGDFAAYQSAVMKYGSNDVELEDVNVDWDIVAKSGGSGHNGELVSTATAPAQIGTIDYVTGEYSVDVDALSAGNANLGNGTVFRFSYTYQIGINLPQTFWLSETKTGAYKGYGHVKEGLNTIEAYVVPLITSADTHTAQDYLALIEKYKWEEGYAYGVVKNVQIGWHKVPTVTIELTDESPVINRTEVDAGSTESSGVASEINVRVIRESINGVSGMKERTLMTKSFVSDDRAYLTEADVVTTSKPDLDWGYLIRDAERSGIATVNYATYRIEKYSVGADGSVSNSLIRTFDRKFDSTRPKAVAVSPINRAVFYTAAPTFRFETDDEATAFSIQVATQGGKIVYDSGIKPLGARIPATVGKYVHEFRAPIYAGSRVLNSTGELFADFTDYKWRVVAYNAKYEDAEDGDYGDWQDFWMDLDNKLSGKTDPEPTGSARLDTVVRYYGPATIADGLVVVEVYENADFRGQPLAQMRVSNIDKLDSLVDVTTKSARLKGITTGTVYVMAYADLNDNGKRDKFEPWGYVQRGNLYTDRFTPLGVTLTDAATEWENPQSVLIILEDTDVNQNYEADGTEDFDSFETSDDDTSDANEPTWWEWARVYDDEADSAVDGDVMAYAEVERTLVGVGSVGETGVVQYYLLAKGEKLPQVGDDASMYEYVTCYKYGEVADSVQIYGLGVATKLNSADLVVKSVNTVTVALVHNQVYQEFGYNPNTANSKVAEEDRVNTKAFTASDKKLLLAYFEAIGYVDAADLALNTTSKSFYDFVNNELAGDAARDLATAKVLWAKYTLKADSSDANGDGIPDGWQLYTMFGPNGEVSASTAWTTPAAARTTTVGGSLTYVQEYDGGNTPTDPWQESTYKETYTTDMGTFTIPDKDAYAFHLKGDEKYADNDNDGIINYYEYVEQKNGGYALDVENAFTFRGKSTYSYLTEQAVPDYFLKSMQSPKYYLGFKITSHDFIETWFKDKYGLDRTKFDPYGDPDADGWSNWAEARAQTNPGKVGENAIDGYTIVEYPTPLISMTVTSQTAPTSLVIVARSTSGSDSQYDAKWVLGNSAQGEHEKFIGYNPGVTKEYNVGGSITPGTFKVTFKDLTGDYETWDTNRINRLSSMKIDSDQTVWAEAVVDAKISNESTKGYLVKRGDGESVVGTIDYASGNVTVYFEELTEGSWRTWDSDTTCVRNYLNKSYVLMKWEAATSAAGDSTVQTITLSDPVSGHVREGLNTFVVFDDTNGDGAYNAGEPLGVVSDIDVGWSHVTDLKINLTKTSPVLPRFQPETYGAVDETTAGGYIITDTGDYRQLISDITEPTRITIARRSINGVDCPRSVIFRKVLDPDGFNTITEADVLHDETFDLDWMFLRREVEAMGYDGDSYTTVMYTVYASPADSIIEGEAYSDEDNAIGVIVKTFDLKRLYASVVSPSEYDTALVTATRPEFTFKAPSGYPAYAFQLLAGTNVVFASTNHLTDANSDGTVTYRPPVYFGAEEAYAPANLLTNGVYSWRVAMLNAKFSNIDEDDWCTAGVFTSAPEKGRVAKGDKGILDVAVRYYGEATIGKDSPLVVEAFKSADFTGVPEGRAVAFSGVGITNVYNEITNVNVRMVGMLPGAYYIRAYIDTTNDLAHSQWESWGYQNKVGIEDRTVADIYTPVATTVVANDTKAALVIMEDTDINNDYIPDCIQGMRPDMEQVLDEDLDGDGLTDREEFRWGTDSLNADTDGDGFPDGYEVWAGLNPISVDYTLAYYQYYDGTERAYRDQPIAYTAVEGDVMADALIKRTVIKTCNAVSKDEQYFVLPEGAIKPVVGKPLPGTEGGDPVKLYITGAYRYYYASYEDYWNGETNCWLYCLSDTTYDVTVNDVVTEITEDFPIHLMHWQVYQQFGFESGVATPNDTVVREDGQVHTRPFFGIDKYQLAELTCGAASMDIARRWGNRGTCLKVNDSDYDKDGIPDGWELYVMMGNGPIKGSSILDNTLVITPWTALDDFKLVKYDAEGYEYQVREYKGYTYREADGTRVKYNDSEWTIADMYNNGVNAADPFNQNSLLPGTGIADKVARRYGLETAENQLKDYDNDGLSNWAEYLALTNYNAKVDAWNQYSTTNVLDYFVKVGDQYLGELVADHDFIEDWWEDQYDVEYVSRYLFDAWKDPDDDGWSNWAEARAGTDPTIEAKLSLVKSDGSEDHALEQYPVPTVYATVNLDSEAALNCNIVVQAWQSDAAKGEPDATWTVPGSGETSEWNSRFLGLAPNRLLDFNIGPGDIAEQHIMLEFYDPHYYIETHQVDSNGVDHVSTETHMIDTSAWGVFYYSDDPTDTTNGRNTGSIGYDFGWVNYLTGDIQIDFTSEELRNTDAQYIIMGSTGDDGSYDYTVYHYDFTRSFWRVGWMSRLTTTGKEKTFSISKADTGYLKEGKNHFMAFADLDGDGVWDEGEPMGFARNVEVGYCKTELNMSLSTKSMSFPRFSVTPSNDVPVRIVRTTINGVDAKRLVWTTKMTENEDGAFTELDYIKSGNFDIDWSRLARDAAKHDIAIEDIEYADFEVYVGEGTNAVPVKSYRKYFDMERAIPVAVAPTASTDYLLRSAQPTFTWKLSDDSMGYNAFVLQIATNANFDAASVAYDSGTNFLPRKTEDGYVFTPKCYVGRELDDGVVYYWRVAMLNAKFRTAAGGWSDAATFKTAVNSDDANTGYGKVAAEIRYYGAATNTLDQVVIEVHKSPDFSDMPVAAKNLSATNTTTKVSSLDYIAGYGTNWLETTANVLFDGVAPGSYYLVAYIDRNANGVRDYYETWGYVCNVGGTQQDIWTPVELKVVSTKAAVPVGLIVMEDVDADNNGIPDDEEPEPPEPPTPTPDIDKDSDDDTIPDIIDDDPYNNDTEEDFAVDRILKGDVMAYEDIDVMFVAIGADKNGSDWVWYALTDLEGEGAKLRDSDIALQTNASDLQSLASIYTYDETHTGIGTNVTFAAGSGLKVQDTKEGSVRLVHAQVYAHNGFESGCASVVPGTEDASTIADGSFFERHPHTKSFNKVDKYAVVRYLEAIGAEGVSERALLARIAIDEDDIDPIFDLYLDDVVDDDVDDLGDGWELYTAYGVTDLKAFMGKAGFAGYAASKISPWNTADGMATAPGTGSQLKLVEEFDGGYYATNPWSVDTDGDTVLDYYAYQYHLKADDAGEDLDEDGLSNYAEYLVSEVFQYAKLDPENPKTDGYCIDYFRKMGDLYLGEIFTDHDQVGDVWEGTYSAAANRYVYDPNRDDDEDGWSNYAEYRAGTDPTSVTSLGYDGYTRNDYPIPVIRAKVVYNGKDVNLDTVVFKAWNEKKDPDMNSAPDAIWTFGNGEASESGSKSTSGTAGSNESGSTLTSKEKYVGVKPAGTQQYLLGGGSLSAGSVKLYFKNKNFSQFNVVNGSGQNSTPTVTTEVGDPDDAEWCYTVIDKATDGYTGRLVFIGLEGEDTTIGTVDYKTGIVTIDFDEITGVAFMNVGSDEGRHNRNVYVNGEDLAIELNGSSTGGQSYQLFNYEGSAVRINWEVKQVGLSANGDYYLADADAVTASAKAHGHVREGKTTFMCYASEDGSYVAGQPFGVVRGVDVGWQGAEFTIELTETCGITDRVNVWDNSEDRDTTIDGALSVMLNDRTLDTSWRYIALNNGITEEAAISTYIENLKLAISNRVQTTSAQKDKVNVRVVRYGIDDMFAYLAGVYDSGVGKGFEQRVVMQKEFDRNGREFICEADFLDETHFDIDWGTMTGEIVDKSGNPISGVDMAGLGVTNMTYLVVIGDGAQEFRGVSDTNTTVYVAGALCRRFDATWAKPKCEGIIGNGDQIENGVLHTARPTFVWSMPEESDWAKRFGTSYTAFNLRIFRKYGSQNTQVYESGVQRAPRQNGDGNFVWTAPLSVGDQTSLGKIFANSAEYYWDVVMYNSKFQPAGDANHYSVGMSFSTSVNTQQPMNDADSSSIGVTVKYTGPEKVLAKCEDMSLTKGKVRVQAFTTADFSGDPVAETYVADFDKLTDASDVLANATLIGLPSTGTYYIRAYIDMNGNFVKDDFESWGYAEDAVKLTTSVIRMPSVGLYIEDADVNNNWYPDAWEYAEVGNWAKDWEDISGKTDAKLQSDGKFTIASAIYAGMTNGTASVSTGLSGSKMTVFQGAAYAQLVLSTGTTLGDFDAIRFAVEKKVVRDTLKVTAITLNPTDSTVTLAIDADVDYANLVSGNFARRLYDFSAYDTPYATVTVKVYKKSTLCQDNWDLVCTVKDVEIGVTDASLVVDIDDKGGTIDTTTGFYKVEVVQ